MASSRARTAPHTDRPMHISISAAERKRILTSALLLPLVLLFLLPLASCDRSGGEEEEDEGAVAPVPVRVEEVTLGEAALRIRASATLSGHEERSVQSESAGRAGSVNVEEGELVERGQALATIESEDVRLGVRDARDSIERLERERERIRPLHEEGLIPRQQWDDIDFQLRQARSTLARAEAQQVRHRIRAPIDGVVTARSVEPGDVVAPNQQLFRISSVDTLEAVVRIPERELARLRTGQEADLEPLALEGTRFAAVVHRIDPVVDPRTGTIRVRLRVTDPDAFTGAVPLRPGMFVTARITTERRADTVLLPRRALVHEGEGTSVFVLREGGTDAASAAHEGPVFRVERMRVRTGIEEGRLVEVLEGPAAGDSVVVVGHAGLDPGALVRLPAPDHEPSSAPSPEPTPATGPEAAAEPPPEEGP